MPRKLRYHVAATVDGFIAHPDHTIDGFVNEGPHADEYLAALKTDYDVVLMGRRTYEFGLQFGVTSPYPWLTQYVVSSIMTDDPDPEVKLVRGDVDALVRQLKAEPGKDIYLCGGADLAGRLLAAGLLDELVVKLNPVVFGAGIPLFSDAISQTALTLIATRPYDNGVVLLTYRVNP